MVVVVLGAVVARAAPSEAGIEVRDGSLQPIGLTWRTPPARTAYRIVDGPLSSTPGITSANAAAQIEATLAMPLVDRGSLLFWFKTDRPYRSGVAAAEFRHKLIELGDAFTVSLVGEKSSLTLIVQWHGEREQVFARHIRVILPEFPGPAWHHVAIRWDGPRGESNVFLDGTPYHLLGFKDSPLPVRAGSGLVLHLQRFALAGVRVMPQPFGDDALREVVGDAAWGRLDTLLGVRDYGPAPADADRGALLYERALGKAEDVRGWVLEGPGIVDFRDGWMHMRSQRPDGPDGHIVHWCPDEFPARFRAEWDFDLIGETGLCIVFFAARGQNGRDLFDPGLKPRNGIFAQYTESDIDCYHISYFANTPSSPRRVANLRKNSGFYLIANGPVGVASGGTGGTHRAILIKDGSRIRMAVDGRTIIDYTDDGQRAGPVWAGGKIGLRQMQWTNARYRNFRVYAR